ncbi:Kinesin-like protein KIF14 isoform X1 [Oopsacas minuta]|uniref:Kinesin-like protein KIF14 isoform X1 n=1 Tax=Oopsacas minuta TaxID=111878 RepID=A0AAV7JRQ2_9METZ|nr:Kinesin-like protein KIF14 isoform X1 [Oopsacas minuta]
MLTYRFRHVLTLPTAWLPLYLSPTLNRILKPFCSVDDCCYRSTYLIIHQFFIAQGHILLEFTEYPSFVNLHGWIYGRRRSPGASQKVILQLEEQLCEKERLMADATRTWMDRLKMTEQRKLEEIDDLRKAGISLGVENTLPNLVNLNEDPQVIF